MKHPGLFVGFLYWESQAPWSRGKQVSPGRVSLHLSLTCSAPLFLASQQKIRMVYINYSTGPIFDEPHYAKEKLKISVTKGPELKVMRAFLQDQEIVPTFFESLLQYSAAKQWQKDNAIYRVLLSSSKRLAGTTTVNMDWRPAKTSGTRFKIQAMGERGFFRQFENTVNKNSNLKPDLTASIYEYSFNDLAHALADPTLTPFAPKFLQDARKLPSMIWGIDRANRMIEKKLQQQFVAKFGKSQQLKGITHYEK